MAPVGTPRRPACFVFAKRHATRLSHAVRARFHVTWRPPMHRQLDTDSLETTEWLDALESVLAAEGPERAHFLLEQLVDKARRDGGVPARTAPTRPTSTRSRLTSRSAPRATTSSSTGCARSCAGTRSRWSCAPGKRNLDLGGHIASFASAATLYDVGFNHFWRAPTKDFGGDLVYFQGHSSPGIYARAFLEGRLTRSSARHVPPGGRRQGHLVLSAPVAHAGLLAVPDGVDGPRPAAGDLPGALPPLPARPRARQHRGAQGLGVHGRRRDGRARVARRHQPRRRARGSTT